MAEALSSPHDIATIDDEPIDGGFERQEPPPNGLAIRQHSLVVR